MERPPHQPMPDVPEDDGSLPTKKDSPEDWWTITPKIKRENSELLNPLEDWPPEKTISLPPNPDNDEK